MIPKRIELENFLSFGKPAVEFLFTDDEPLWVLCGKNGAGKSAVFDGITYALYGEHRGGAQKAEQLVRHGSNGFRVVLEFEFAGAEYRITRARAGKTTQKVERQSKGEWQALPGVNSAAEVKAWVEKTLGLGYKAFTTSVLLCQGEADKLFSASRGERLALLKGIIGFEQFEEVSSCVHAATLERGNDLNHVQSRISALVPVTTEELEVAEAAVVDAERAWGEAQAKSNLAAQRVEQARQWEGLAAKQAELGRQLAEANKRAEDADTIRAAKARLDDLSAALPVLESLIQFRDQIAAMEPKFEAAESSRVQTAADIEVKIKAAEEARQKASQHHEAAGEFSRQAKGLGEEVGRGTKFLALAEGVETLKTKLTAYPPDLADQLVAAEAEEKAAGEAKVKEGGSLAAAKALLGQAQDQQQRFANVQIGATCSNCGQRVDETHAVKERARLAAEIRNREAEAERLQESLSALEKAHSTAHTRWFALQQHKREFDQVATQLAAEIGSLTQLGGITNPVELRSRLASQLEEKTRAEQSATDERTKHTEALAEIKRLETERKTLERTLKMVTETAGRLSRELASARGGYVSGTPRLAPDWQARLPDLDLIEVTALAAERDQLQASGVAVRFEALRQDETKRAEWAKQLNDVRTDIERIPAEAQVREKEAKQRQEETKKLEKSAQATRDTAVRDRDQLKSRADELKQLTTELRRLERARDLHQKLDNLLGQNGLQRELVRDAENQVVTLANDTLQNLSDGDLSLEADDEAAGRDDKAFALWVRRAGDAFPTGVMFLSSSQKFRVAVSVALAVGRFATGRARPLEAVIIDEGFGSLDKEGLRAMADELKRLQRSQALKRVVLVSHQEEFTDQFPVGYWLRPGESGTTAAPFRR